MRAEVTCDEPLSEGHSQAGVRLYGGHDGHGVVEEAEESGGDHPQRVSRAPFDGTAQRFRINCLQRPETGQDGLLEQSDLVAEVVEDARLGRVRPSATARVVS